MINKILYFLGIYFYTVISVLIISNITVGIAYFLFYSTHGSILILYKDFFSDLILIMKWAFPTSIAMFFLLDKIDKRDILFYTLRKILNPKEIDKNESKKQDELLKSAFLDQFNQCRNDNERLQLITWWSEKKIHYVYVFILHLIDSDYFKGDIKVLVKALKNYPTEPIFNRAIKWIVYGDFEIAHEAFEIINSISNVSIDDADITYKNTLLVYNNDNHEEWRKELLGKLLKKLNDICIHTKQA